MQLGIHVSIAKQMDLSIDRAAELGCVGVFQIFTCSPRRWAAKPLDPEVNQRFRTKISNSNFKPVVHMPYMPNLSSSEERFYQESIGVLIREIKRCAELGIGNLVVHFGSSSGFSIEQGRTKIVSAIRKAIDSTGGSKVRILLENSADTHHSAGSRFEHIRMTLDAIDDENRDGVCLDTCHAYASGYDLRTAEGVAKTIEEFDNAIGLRKLFLIHANDSKVDLGKGVDRHDHIGLGRIGNLGFKTLFNLKETKDLPFVLETPIDGTRGDKENIEHAKKLFLTRK